MEGLVELSRIYIVKTFRIVRFNILISKKAFQRFLFGFEMLISDSDSIFNVGNQHHLLDHEQSIGLNE